MTSRCVVVVFVALMAFAGIIAVLEACQEGYTASETPTRGALSGVGAPPLSRRTRSDGTAWISASKSFRRRDKRWMRAMSFDRIARCISSMTSYRSVVASLIVRRHRFGGNSSSLPSLSAPMRSCSCTLMCGAARGSRDQRARRSRLRTTRVSP